MGNILSSAPSMPSAPPPPPPAPAPIPPVTPLQVKSKEAPVDLQASQQRGAKRASSDQSEGVTLLNQNDYSDSKSGKTLLGQ